MRRTALGENTEALVEHFSSGDGGRLGGALYPHEFGSEMGASGGEYRFGMDADLRDGAAYETADRTALERIIVGDFRRVILRVARVKRSASAGF